ncbi:hypothetical protein D0862_06825 [Hortaea werneckii]|uniref:Xylanolytic transcriptional activator regulatory domain-containing protein n=1 Tax=Hortaea werneckii TaxID=91943 RepID=A0A3M7GG84_HORWE|nr:hypothetical protein D0862_06825 [Hortaea werneckii]
MSLTSIAGASRSRDGSPSERRRAPMCDGAHPICNMCRTRRRRCHYETEEGESRQKALKRKHDQLEASHNELSDFVTCLAKQDNSTVLDVMRKVRTGGNIGDLLQSLRSRTASRETSLGSDRREKQVLILSNVMQVLQSGLHSSTRQTMLHDDPLDMPLDIFPAAPWTRMTDDDMLVSRLVTIFLNYQNAYWRYLEADLFLQAMKHAQPPSNFCSAFLVNAVLAMASLSAEHRAVFFEPGDYTSRGRQFHEEAMRLWILEDGRASVTSLQALVILSMDASLRGKDKLGMSLLAVALQINKDLPHVATSSEHGGPGALARARACIGWTAHFTDVTCSMGLMKASSSIDRRLAMVPFMPDRLFSWTARPFGFASARYRGNVLFRERCMLTRLTHDLNQLFFAGDGDDMPSLVQAALSLRERLHDWYESLTSDLKYDRRLPAFLHEIHCEYFCVRMTLASTLGARLKSQTSPSEQRSREHHIAVEADAEHFKAAYWTSEAADVALKAAKILENYRSVYGLKTVLPFIFQAATTASFILLDHCSRETGRRRPNDELHSIEAFEDPRSGLEESFRCLLGVATQVSIARGAALMLLKTAKIMKFELPASVMRLPQTVAEIAWVTKNDRGFSSSYPNYALVAAKGGRPEGLTMEELLNKWSNLSI